DSRIEAIKADGTARSEARIWALNKQSDRSDNAITYSYTEDQTDGSYRINRIDYGGNATAGTTATSSVRFVYERRGDSRSSYQAGAKIRQGQRLTNVQTYDAETLVSDYRLTYDNKVAGYPDDPNATAPISCKAILDAGDSTGNGYYQIDPDGSGGIAPIDAYCNMTDHGGGWTLAGSISASNKNHFQASSHDSNGNYRVDYEQLGEKLEDSVITALYSDRLWVNIVGGSGDIHCEKANQSGAGLSFVYNYSPTCGYSYSSTQSYAGDGANNNWGINVWKNYDYRAYKNNYSGCNGAAATYVPSGNGGCNYHPSRGGYLWVR
ncbi:fibrinogen-like YCDxxxxGGGW domain-containing protein, partial [Kiloniella majae]|uniref:fibrinogen-like YCDxxxxGGGW domain-containing protein n=1 Tax=Kiloniella majae TaxID=1938558 RepID=UPI001C3F7AC0